MKAIEFKYNDPTVVETAIVKTTGEMQSLANDVNAAGGRIIVVPTMGYLHEGHRALIRRAKEEVLNDNDKVVLTIFVNPTQFGIGEDLDKYPKDFSRDLDMAREESVDIVFTPTKDDMYPEGFKTTVTADESLANRLCGLARPTHFSGVTTIVAKLFNITKAHKAVFGKKDYQQLAIIKRMAGDLNFDINIIAACTVREPSGLALSSRNSYLSSEEKEAALLIPSALKKADDLIKEGITESALIINAMEKVLSESPLITIDYISICNRETLEDIDKITPSKNDGLIALAVKIGTTRLIDNLEISN